MLEDGSHGPITENAQRHFQRLLVWLLYMEAIGPTEQTSNS